MHIYIFGNLNSGKTMLSKQMQGRLPEFTYLSLDEYRIRFGEALLLKSMELNLEATI